MNKEPKAQAPAAPTEASSNLQPENVEFVAKNADAPAGSIPAAADALDNPGVLVAPGEGEDAGAGRRGLLAPATLRKLFELIFNKGLAVALGPLWNLEPEELTDMAGAWSRQLSEMFPRAAAVQTDGSFILTNAWVLGPRLATHLALARARKPDEGADHDAGDQAGSSDADLANELVHNARAEKRAGSFPPGV